MFSQASVIISTGEGHAWLKLARPLQSCTPATHTPWPHMVPPPRHAPRCCWQEGGAHPTGMLSCLVLDNGGIVHELDHTSISPWEMTFCSLPHAPLSGISGMSRK